MTRHIEQHYREVLEQFRGFLRSLMMHAGVGTSDLLDDTPYRAALSRGSGAVPRLSAQPDDARRRRD
ncbi:hypothetical protein C0U41_29795, partial [Klebsiella pneumoniae]